MMKEQTVLITGATSGIGEATARLLASEGLNLILTGRRNERLNSLCKELKDQYGIDCLPLDFDIRKIADVREALSGLEGKWQNIDILINNAGLAAGLAYVHEADWDDWEQMIDTNLKGLFYLSRLIAPGMVERGSGHIINITSIAGKEVYSKGSVYCATKHAVDAFTRGLRIDLVPYSIKVSAIAPGAVNTEFSMVRFKGDREKAEKVYEGFEPLLAEDIAQAVLFIISRPPHVNINDLLIMPTAQANSGTLVRKS